MSFLVSTVKYMPCHITLKCRCPIKTRTTCGLHAIVTWHLTTFCLTFDYYMGVLSQPLTNLCMEIYKLTCKERKEITLYEKCGPYVLTFLNLVGRGQKHATYCDTYIGVVHGKFVVKKENLDDMLRRDWTMFWKHINHYMRWMSTKLFDDELKCMVGQQSESMNTFLFITQIPTIT